MTETDANALIQEAMENWGMTQCPYYRGDGICQMGCRDEPECQTCEPTEGWVQAAIDLLADVNVDSPKSPGVRERIAGCTWPDCTCPSYFGAVPCLDPDKADKADCPPGMARMRPDYPDYPLPNPTRAPLSGACTCGTRMQPWTGCPVHLTGG